MKYQNFMQADEKQMYEWVKTGKASFHDFKKWFDEKMDESREAVLDKFEMQRKINKLEK